MARCSGSVLLLIQRERGSVIIAVGQFAAFIEVAIGRLTVERFREAIPASNVDERLVEERSPFAKGRVTSTSLRS